MNIAYIHYHLNTGGVTTVLRHQAESFWQTENVLVLTGETVSSGFPVPTIVIEGLGYDTPTRGSPPAKTVADAVLSAIHSHFNGPCDLLHVHNPTIAKNKQFLRILRRLQQTGIPLFLQIHDLAEDGRPDLLYHQPYPANCHFGVINSRDYTLLHRSGLRLEGLHLIPNMVDTGVSAAHTAAEWTDSGDIVLYPVRGIRRKNIGEAVLLSIFFEKNTPIVITLPPKSPIDMRAYEGWIRFVRDLNLNVVFGAGRQFDFGRLVQNARFILTTSISEGFGFSFLEPWLAGKLLWGRRLADICRDFECHGINYEHLYSRFTIPLDWLPKDSFRPRWTTSLLKNMALFGRKLDTAGLESAFESITTGGTIDFGLLDESFQKRVIIRVAEERSSAAELVRINPFLARPGIISQADRLIEGNRQAVSTAYNASDYRKSLRRIYDRVRNINVSHHLDNAPLVEYFMRPSNFSLLKWGSYAE